MRSIELLLSQVVSIETRYRTEKQFKGSGPVLLRLNRLLGRAPLMPEPPPPNVKRWTPHRKAAVLTAVRSGTIIVEEACRRYEISEEEFLAWQQAFETHGPPGLRTTRIQQYRYRRFSRGRRPSC